VSSSRTYESAVAEVRRPNPTAGAEPDYRELIRLGSLAASSHNTQPWKFTGGGGSIRILPDFSRRCPVVDPDDAHLFKSLGCAAENIVHAAAAQGLRADVSFVNEDGVVMVHLTPDPTCGETDLARAIPLRQCTKARYDASALDSEQLAALTRAGTGDGVRVILLTADDQKRTVTEFVNRGNQVQLSDPAWRAELFAWIRSNDRESLERGDGLSGRTSGQPSVPTWLARLILPLVVRPKSQIKTDAANIRSSAGVAVFVTKDDDAAAWVEAGRCYERFALQATALNVRNAFINQPIEVPSVRPDYERWLGLQGERAQLMARFGNGPQMPFSIRRPLDDVIVSIDENA
jgi:hypothetical protein